ncbi:hypothetical protein PVAP13_6KG402400 [Panicum virgatum]|uniref:Uncharacterized protein n=1 Tax=Panicum virgatum TaxID=38727 RepID=A0A8T0RL54_PANVG|nr:hypothetical protein PVAP13_6KG402400 [Panicum virgatum]
MAGREDLKECRSASHSFFGSIVTMPRGQNQQQGRPQPSNEYDVKSTEPASKPSGVGRSLLI